MSAFLPFRSAILMTLPCRSVTSKSGAMPFTIMLSRLAGISAKLQTPRFHINNVGLIKQISERG